MAKTTEEAEQNLNQEPPKRTYSKKHVETRSDGGPVTRSKSVQLQQQTNGAKISYANVVKNSTAKVQTDQQSSRQNDKINYAKIQARCIKNADPLETNTDQREIF